MHTGATLQHERELLAGADLVVASSAPLQREALRIPTEFSCCATAVIMNILRAPAGCAVGVPSSATTAPLQTGLIRTWLRIWRRGGPTGISCLLARPTGDVSRLSKSQRSPDREKPTQRSRMAREIRRRAAAVQARPSDGGDESVKAYEILASGKPLVSVPLPEMIALAPWCAWHRPHGSSKRRSWQRSNRGCAAGGERRRSRGRTLQKRFEEFAQAVPDAFPRASVVVVTTDNLEASRRCLTVSLREPSGRTAR